jgi:hypothetical protein
MRSNPRSVTLPRALIPFPVRALGPGTVLEDEPEVVSPPIEGKDDSDIRETVDD